MFNKELLGGIGTVTCKVKVLNRGDVSSIAERFYPRSQSGDIGFQALFDQVEPVNSFDGSSIYLRLRPQSGNKAWVQYDFDREYEISEASVYWKDDKQYCSMPRSWYLEYKSGDTWLPVINNTDYTVEKDRYNTVSFEPLAAEGLRLNITLNGINFMKGSLVHLTATTCLRTQHGMNAGL